MPCQSADWQDLDPNVDVFGDGPSQRPVSPSSHSPGRLWCRHPRRTWISHLSPPWCSEGSCPGTERLKQWLLTTEVGEEVQLVSRSEAPPKVPGARLLRASTLAAKPLFGLRYQCRGDTGSALKTTWLAVGPRQWTCYTSRFALGRLLFSLFVSTSVWVLHSVTTEVAKAVYGKE